jgi:DNA polymerase-4
MDKIIMHIDVNNAFLSWTAIDLLNNGYPIDIRNEIAIIGGDESKRHGIVLAKSTPAKKYGIKTAETIRDAKRKYPDLKIYSPKYDWYLKMSKALFKLINQYTDDIEIWSIDECLIDYTPIRNINGDPIKFAYKLKREIYEKLGFTVNIGIGNNKLCAKMASDFSKPDKVHTLFLNEIDAKMYPLPVSDLFGIGKKTSVKLHELGIDTIGDLANYDELLLCKYFKNQAHHMILLAHGIDSDIIISDRGKSKGISNETTTNYNLNSLDEINEVLYNLVENVCTSLRNSNRFAKVIGVKFKDKYFKTMSHQKKLVNATNSTKEVYEIVKMLARELWNDEGIRLVGVSLTQLVENNNYQLSMFENPHENISNSKLDKVIDDLKKQYGSDIINKASLLNKNKIHKHYE